MLMASRIQRKTKGIKQGKYTLLYHFEVGGLLYEYENMETFHMKKKIETKYASQENLLEISNHNYRHQERKKMELINRVLYIFDEIEKIYGTEGIKPKQRKSFLNYNLVSSEIIHLMKKGDLSSVTPKLKHYKSMKDQNVCWDKIRAILEEKDLVNKPKL